MGTVIDDNLKLKYRMNFVKKVPESLFCFLSIAFTIYYATNEQIFENLRETNSIVRYQTMTEHVNFFSTGHPKHDFNEQVWK